MSKFISDCPPPEPRLAEFIQVLTEECCEVGQRGMKALRFGDLEVQPGQDLNNLERLQEEVGDIVGVIQQMCNEGYLEWNKIQEQADKKKIKLQIYMQTEKKCFNRLKIFGYRHGMNHVCYFPSRL